jgi:hypothetical protein
MCFCKLQTYKYENAKSLSNYLVIENLLLVLRLGLMLDLQVLKMVFVMVCLHLL